MGVLGILLCAVAIGCASCADEALQEFVDGNAKFSANVIRFETDDQHNKGIISPLSAQLVLSLIADGAKGDTYTEMKKALNLPDKNRTRAAVKSLIPLLNTANDNFQITLANKLFVDEKYKVKEDFEDVAKSEYSSEIQNVNFTDYKQATEIVNAWVINKTADHFQNFMSIERFNANTTMTFVNGLYLKGKWETPFPKKNTKRELFYFLRKDPGDVDTMHSTGQYMYFHCGYLQAKFLEIPIKDTTVKVTFILPDARDGIRGLEEKVELFFQPHNLTLKTVDVSLPKFIANTYHDFTEFLEKLKATKVLSDDADLSGISDSKTFLKSAPQRAFIKINEQGVDAASTSADIAEYIRKGRAVADPSGLTFKADHPFFYFFRETKSNVILLVGRFQ